MAKVKNIEDVIAEQAVRKAATCYSRGVDRSDLELLNLIPLIFKAQFEEVVSKSIRRPSSSYCLNPKS